MCHPGICDAELEKSSTRLKQQRQVELDALLDADVENGRSRIRRAAHAVPGPQLREIEQLGLIQ